MRLTLSLIGLAAAAVLSLLCWLVEGPLIEQHLAEQVGVALGQAQVSGVGVALDGRDLALTGTVASVEERARAIAAAASVSGLRQTRADIEIQRPEPQRAQITARKLPTGRVVLGGTVSQSAHDVLIAQAQALLGATQIVDEIQVAPGGAGLEVVQPLVEALPYVARFQKGEAVSEPGQLTLRGVTSSLASVVDTRSELEARLSDTELIVALDRTWSPEDFSVTVTRVGDGLRLEGAVPNLAQHTKLIHRAEELWGQDAVDDQLAVAAIARSADRNRCLRSAMTRLPDLQGGVLTQSAAGLRVQGAVASPVVRTELEERLRRDCGLQEVDIDLPQALSTAECQARLSAMLIGEPIRFLGEQAVIAPISEADLARLAETLRACPGAALIVTGHTDSEGDPAENLRLSQQRADAVRERLINLDIPAERIQSVGKGDTEPVASNARPVGRAKNRRITFTLVEPSP